MTTTPSIEKMKGFLGYLHRFAPLISVVLFGVAIAVSHQHIQAPAYHTNSRQNNLVTRQKCS